MERAAESLDDLQPQDLSTTTSISTVIDLTRKGEECLSSVASLNSLVKSPRWSPNPATCGPQLTLTESPGSLDVKLQSGDQIQLDDALSHTTVTLSYVSRSHVCTTLDSFSQHSPLSSLPAISVLPLGSPPDTEAHRDPNQHYKTQAEQSVHPNIPTEHFLSPSRAQLGSQDHDPAKESHKVKSGFIFRDTDEPFQEENSPSQRNSAVDGWKCPDVFAQTSPEPVVPALRDGEEIGDFEVLCDDPLVVPDGTGVTNLSVLNQKYVSPLEDPVDPSVTLQDCVEDVFDLPQDSISPSSGNCCPDTTDGLAWDGSSPEGANQLGSAYMGPESTRRDKQPVQKQNAVAEVVCPSGDSENKLAGAHINGNAAALQRTLNEKKTPAHAGRGTRLESVVMNIGSSGCKVSGSIATNTKSSFPRLAECAAIITNSESNGKPSLQKRISRAEASLLGGTEKQTVIPVDRGNGESGDADGNRDSTSDSPVHRSDRPQNSAAPKSPPPAAHANSTKRPEQLASSDPAVDVYLARVSPHAPPSKSPKKIKGKAAGSGGATNAAVAAKTTGSHRSRRKTLKRRKRSQGASMFSPWEPEIKLRYLAYKEEKRDPKAESFSPFVRVERQQLSPWLCTVVNYPEEVRTDPKRGQQTAPGGFRTGAVPGTSSLRLGRPSAHSQHQRPLVCCLCGQSANAMDLGDLHGPYYPEGCRPAAKGAAGGSGLKEEDGDSDSDSSSPAVKERGRKRAMQQPLLRLRDSGGPAAKRTAPDVDSAGPEDWYSAPVLPLEPREYWLHEDCGVWSAGVYLVKGKVFGLEEALRAAQETVTSAPSSLRGGYTFRLREMLRSRSHFGVFFPPRVRRGARRAARRGPRWGASPNAVRTSTTTGVRWSQVSAVLGAPPRCAGIKGQRPTHLGYQRGGGGTIARLSV